MKTLRIFATVITLLIFSLGMKCMAQETSELTILIKGIKEAKGKMMIAVCSLENPQEMISEMMEVADTENIVCVSKNVPVGKVNLYIFQDLNGNCKLDQDEKQIPIEPCYSKEKLTIEAGENKVTAKLINVKEMMGL
ncbi:MAG: DUF2141 domain-containing protein [Tannerellaceae bacterium]|jgi:uncharacterized protein (DUF2141 family)|nr:DUF2141 domain-containing protein [Tannerellaceae bacterium]